MHLDWNFEVERPIEEVFDAWVDLDRAIDWTGGAVLERRKITDGPTGVGTRFAARDQFPGRVLEFEVEFIEYDRPHVVAASWNGVMGGGWRSVFEESNGVTQVDLDADLIPQGLLRLMTPVIARFAGKEIGKDMTRFKEWVEAGQPARSSEKASA